VIPLIIEKESALSQSKAQNVQVRCLFSVVFEAIFKHQTGVSPKLIIGFVDIEIDLIHDASQIHRISDDLEIIWATVLGRVDRLAEENSIVNIVFGEVEQLGADEH
jgi:hypothetical protein